LLLLFDCTLTSQINYKYRIFSFVKFYMESTNQKVWVKYGTGQAVKVSVPSGDDVSDLKKLIKGELELTERLFEIELYKPEEERKEGGGEGKDGETETVYRPGKLVSLILAEWVGVDDENPIFIRTTQQGIYN
jgi:hypothetical protein